MGAPTLSFDPAYTGYSRPGWHSSGLPLVEEPLAALTYLSDPKRCRAPSVLSEAAQEFAGKRTGAACLLGGQR